MPRQIIDTESSRPQYVRRLALRWTAAVLLLLAAAAIVVWAYEHFGHAAVPGK